MESANAVSGEPDSGIMADNGEDSDDCAGNKSVSNHTQYGNILYLDGHITGVVGKEWYQKTGNYLGGKGSW